MKIIKQTTIIFAICFIGDIISHFLPFPFPGSVLAMIMLFLCFILRIIKVETVQEVSDFLLKNMTILFIPPTVSIIEYTHILKSVFWRFIFICLITTLICFLCTAYSVKATMYIMKRLKERKKNNA